MNFVKKRLCILLLMSAAMGIAVSGCGSVTIKPENAPSEIPIIPVTSTPANIPSPSLTNIPMTSPAALNTATAELNWTALPTLPPHDAEDRIHQLFNDIEGCAPPCWWGIEPGKTTWSEGMQYLSRFLSVDRSLLPNYSEEWVGNGSVLYLSRRYSLSYELSDGLRGFVNIEGRNDTIWMIFALPPSTLGGYQIDQLLSRYGSPAKVFVRTFSDVPFRPIPFTLTLFYPDQRILVEFDFYAIQDQSIRRGCPQNVSPFLRMWKEGEMVTEVQVRQWVDPDPIKPMLSLEDATGMEIDDFYETFVDPNSEACIETPAELW